MFKTIAIKFSCHMAFSTCTATGFSGLSTNDALFSPIVTHYCYASPQLLILFLALEGEGPLAFCSGGDQSVRGKGGYVGEDNIPRLNVLDLQMQIRRLPKPVIAMVAGYAVGGGHILHMVCDLTVSVQTLDMKMPCRCTTLLHGNS
jgi:hypothetical protein